IGNAVAKELHKFGAHIIALDISVESLLSLKRGIPQIEIYDVDLRDWTATKSIVTKFKNVDLLLNNAGYVNCAAVGEVTEEDFDNHFKLNVKAIVNITQEIAQSMIKGKKGGSIVNISSQAGIVALKDHLIYCATKGAVDQLTRTFALELSPYNIRVNSVNPTVVKTEMGKRVWSANILKASEMLAKIPLNRFAEVGNVVDTILFLLSDKTRMINGVRLPIDGGFTAC
ncbi:L-xylulose reductase-like protein, partial [Dinothrombium tinctorium]